MATTIVFEHAGAAFRAVFFLRACFVGFTGRTLSTVKTLRSKYVLPMSSPAIEDGAVLLEGNKIMGVGRWADLKTPDAIDLGESILMPGLINAHCHLDYTCLRGAILPPESFASWILRINDIKRTLTDDDYLASVQQGLEESLRAGTTTILNIESFPEILLNLKRPTPRVWWFLELLDIRSRFGTEELVVGALSLLDQPADWLGGPGLSPHAPFTTSLALYRLAAECASLRQVPVMTHLAETQEEFDLFVHGRGPLHDFLAKLGRDMTDLDGQSPVARLFQPGVLPKGAILTHMNALTESDWDLLAARVDDFSVVHCPRCHSYFGRPEFPIHRFLESGINLCLGTDSLASNWSLDLFAEMRHLREIHPSLPSESVLHMVTRAAAKAIGQEGLLGEIAPGAHADLIALPMSGPMENLHAAAIEITAPPHWVMVNGVDVG